MARHILEIPRLVHRSLGRKFQNVQYKPLTLEYTQQNNRLKAYFGSRYEYGSNKVDNAKLLLNVDHIPAVIREVEAHLKERSMMPQTHKKVDQVLAVMYQKNGVLGIHMDSPKLFDRPICKVFKRDLHNININSFKHSIIFDEKQFPQK